MSGITAFPAASVLVSGQSIIGKSDSGAGICAELSPSAVRTLISAQPLNAALTALAGVTTAANKLVYATGANTFATTDLTAFARTILDDADAATVLSTIGAQATLVSGTSIKTINGTSLLGSGDITISGGGTPGGSTTQIQFNSSGAFAATDRFTWNGSGMAVQRNSTDHAVLSILPNDPEPGYRGNLPWNLNVYQNAAANSPNLSYNMVVTCGHNLSPGGGRVSSSDSAIGWSMEQSYEAGDITAGGLELTEYHDFFVARDTANGVTAGQTVRLMSYTINKQTNSIDFYNTVSRHYIKRIDHATFSNAEKAVFWNVQPGGLSLTTGVEGAQEHSMSCTLTGTVGVGAGLIAQWTCTGSFVFNRDVAVSGQLFCNGFTVQSSGNLTVGNGGQIISQDTRVNSITTPGGIFMSNGCYIAGKGARLEKITPDANGNANEIVLACRDNGSGKMQLVVVMPTGSIKVVATED